MRDLDEIEIHEPAIGFNSSKYEGIRIKLAEIKEIETINWYNGKTEDGKNNAYNPQSTEVMHKIEIITEQLPMLDEETGIPLATKMFVGKEKTPLTVSARFNLKKEGDNWVISKHPKGALWKFMRKMGVEKLSGLKGKVVTLTTEPSANPDDDRQFLRIVI